MTFAKPIVTVTALFALAFGSAYAGGTASKEKNPGFNALDTNHDGQLSAAEAAGNSALSKNFASADKNHDVFLSRTEYLTVMTKSDFATLKEKLSHVLGGDASDSSAGGSGASPKK